MARRKLNRPKPTTVLILTEGPTEKIYFRKLKQYYRNEIVTVDGQKEGRNPRSLIERALREQSAGNYVQIWCVYDCDVFLKEDMSSFEKLFQSAKNDNIKFAESMPSIEAWFFLHFAKPKPVYPSGEALVKDLQNYISDYCKDQKWLERNLYNALQPNEYNAFANVTDFSNIDYKQPNVATTVDKLVEIFIKRGCV